AASCITFVNPLLGCGEPRARHTNGHGGAGAVHHTLLKRFAQNDPPRQHTALSPSASLHILLVAYAMIRVLMRTHAPPQPGEVVHGLLPPPRSGRRSPAPASAGDVSGTPAPVSAG